LGHGHVTCSTEVTALERSFPHHVAATVVVETTTKWCLKAARGSVKLIPPALAILALPPDAIVRADAAADAVLALASLAVMLAGARAPAVLADAPLAVMLADAGAPAILADAPVAVMLADAGAPAILALLGCSCGGYAGRCSHPRSPCTCPCVGYARTCWAPSEAGSASASTSAALHLQLPCLAPPPRACSCSPASAPPGAPLAVLLALAPQLAVPAPSDPPSTCSGSSPCATVTAPPVSRAPRAGFAWRPPRGASGLLRAGSALRGSPRLLLRDTTCSCT